MPFFTFLGPGKETTFFNDKAETTIKNVPEQSNEVTMNGFQLKRPHFNAVIYGPLSFKAFMVLHYLKGQVFGEKFVVFPIWQRELTCEVIVSTCSNSTINCSSKRKAAFLSPASGTCRMITDWILVVRWCFLFYFYFFPPFFSMSYFQ